MIFIKFFSDDGFWIVWSIAIMERTVLDDEVVLILPTAEILSGKNVWAFLVCGFLIKS